MVHDGMFKTLVENTSDVIIVTDTDFRIRYVSSSVEKIFGIEPVKVIGTGLLSYVPLEKRQEWEACMTMLTDSVFRDEISIPTDQKGYLYFDIEVSRYETGKTAAYLLKLHDITAKKSKERDLVNSNKQMDQVIYKTTHDLKAPILSALGLVELAEKAKDVDKNYYLDLVRKSLLKLNGFIDEMNDFFRNEKLAIQRDEIDLRSMVAQELEDVQNLITSQAVDIRVDVIDVVPLFSDSLRLRTIIGNLLSNAIKYRDEAKSRPYIQISFSVNTEFCELRFVDNGIGIAAEHMGKIFDMFYRGTEQSQGTGLGLFIVKDTVEKLKGSVEVSSTPGQGTMFVIRFPNQIHQPIVVA